MVDETGKTGHDAASSTPSNIPTPQGASAPAGAPSASPLPPAEPALKNDIAKILSEIKLPERHSADLTGEHKKQAEIKPIDALLSGETTPTQPANSAGAASIAPTAPAQTPVAEPTVTPAQAARIPSMHTLKDDLQGVVQDQKISVVRAAALEQDKRRGVEHLEIAARPSRLKGILLAIGMLLVLGLFALFGVYYYVTNTAAPVPVPQTDSLVFAESSVSLPLGNTTPSTLKQQLAAARSTNGSLGAITRVVPTVTDGAVTRPATFSEFMQAMGAKPPDDLVRALSDDFFLGFHTVDKNAPVIIVKVNSYDRAFAGMLSWEATINADLAPLFTAVPQFVIQDGIPTQRTFTDSVFRNYDVRTLSDDSGQIQMYYSFPSRGVLIIAESPYTFTEVLTRLQARSAL
ncbi:MAG TPA: hypothetical protein VHD38_00985 [Candidatus Paceibacterota bacterium]|nr:hypothetical protein [Candidatus Paceibacterota bacterium]